jgi:tRNA wybutosine-synthesizing protein 4
MFVDIDYEELMMKKRDVVTTTAALNSLLTNMQVPLEGGILLRSDEYVSPELSLHAYF